MFLLRHESAVLVKQKFVVLVRTMKRKTSFGGTLEIHATFLLRKKVFSLTLTVHMSNSVGGISVTVSDIWFRHALNVQQKCHPTNRTKQSYISDKMNTVNTNTQTVQNVEIS